jgi:hypothetical protein
MLLSPRTPSSQVTPTGITNQQVQQKKRAALLEHIFRLVWKYLASLALSRIFSAVVRLKLHV